MSQTRSFRYKLKKFEQEDLVEPWREYIHIYRYVMRKGFRIQTTKGGKGGEIHEGCTNSGKGFSFRLQI